MTQAIFHLSFPVTDLEIALDFYTSTLSGVIGRRGDMWADVALFGAQVTLQHAPTDVLQPMPRTRHFGATIGWQEWERVVGRFDTFVENPCISYRGTDKEQGKAMIADPSGNYIEIKAYRNPIAVLGDLGRAIAS